MTYLTRDAHLALKVVLNRNVLFPQSLVLVAQLTQLRLCLLQLLGRAAVLSDLLHVRQPIDVHILRLLHGQRAALHRLHRLQCARLLILNDLLLLVHLVRVLGHIANQLGELVHHLLVQRGQPLRRRPQHHPDRGERAVHAAGRHLAGQLRDLLGIVLLDAGLFAQELGQVLGGCQAVLHVVVQHIEAAVLLALRTDGGWLISGERSHSPITSHTQK